MLEDDLGVPLDHLSPSSFHSLSVSDDIQLDIIYLSLSSLSLFIVVWSLVRSI